MDKLTEAKILIDQLGGTGKAAKFFEVEPPSISGWKKDGIPKARMQYLRAVRPDLFSDSGTPLLLPNTVQ